MLELDRLRWHQRLFVLQSVDDPSLDGDKNLSINLLAWTSDRSTRSLVGLSTSSSINVRLPAGVSNVTLIYLSVSIRDQYGCRIEFDIPPVSITRDTTTIAMLINVLQPASSHSNAANQLYSNEIVQLLANGNQNEVNQLLVSLSQMLNTMSADALQTTVMSAANLPATALSVSSLDRPWTPVSDRNTAPFSCDSSPMSSIVNKCIDVGHGCHISSCRIQAATKSGSDGVGLPDAIRVQSVYRRDRQHRSAIVHTRRTDQVDIGIDSRCDSKTFSHSDAINCVHAD
jgi:hypothetical protein